MLISSSHCTKSAQSERAKTRKVAKAIRKAIIKSGECHILAKRERNPEGFAFCSLCFGPAMIMRPVFTIFHRRHRRIKTRMHTNRRESNQQQIYTPRSHASDAKVGKYGM